MVRLNAKKEGLKLLREMSLRSVFFTDRYCRGATDAVHYFGFGSDIKSAILPRPEVGLTLCVRHYLDGGGDFFGTSPVQIYVAHVTARD